MTRTICFKFLHFRLNLYYCSKKRNCREDILRLFKAGENVIFHLNGHGTATNLHEGNSNHEKEQ